MRAVRMVRDHLDGYPSLTAACHIVAGRVGVGAEALRRWLRQAQVDAGVREGMTTADSDEMRRLRKENRELEEANSILRDAAASFAGELDPRSR